MILPETSQEKEARIMSKMYQQIKDWYDQGRWSKKKVGDAVAKGKITVWEYELITGEAYPGE